MVRAGGCGLLLAMSVATAAYGADLRIDITNEYVTRIDLGPLGGGKRFGTDTLVGTLVEQPDGSYEGTVAAKVDMHQELRGPFGMNCPLTHYVVEQELRVRTRPETDWNAASTITFDRAAGPGGRSGKFVSLDVIPNEAPSVASSACLSMFVLPSSSHELLPLNDGRWTQPGDGYTIELPTSGVLVWRDATVNTYPLIGTTSPGPADAFSKWRIEVERL